MSTRVEIAKNLLRPPPVVGRTLRIAHLLISPGGKLVVRLRSPLSFKRSPSPSACCTEVHRTSQFTLYARRVSLGIRPSYRRNLRGNFHASGVALWATLWGSTASRCNVRLESTNTSRTTKAPGFTRSTMGETLPFVALPRPISNRNVGVT